MPSDSPPNILRMESPQTPMGSAAAARLDNSLRKRTGKNSTTQIKRLDCFYSLLKEIHSTKRFTNAGSCHAILEDELARLLGHRHCVLFANASLALLLALSTRRTETNREVRISNSLSRRQLDLVDWAGMTTVGQPAVSSYPAVSLLSQQDISDEQENPVDSSAESSILTVIDCSETCDDILTARDIVEQCADKNTAIVLNPAAFASALEFHSACVVTSSKSLAEELRVQRNFGFAPTETGKSSLAININAKLNEIHAAIALAAIPCTDLRITKTRRVNHESESRVLHVGQMNTPEWQAMSGRFADLLSGSPNDQAKVVSQFETRLAMLLNVRNVVCTTNCTIALTAMLKALNLSGEVIVPAFTFPATVQAIQLAGLTPRFCDIDPQTHTISAELAEPLVTPETSAILGMHCWGRPCDPHQLEELCGQHKLRLMFDAAHAMGCSSNGKPVGSHGDASAFSFHATKIVNCTEGGCVATDDDRLADTIRSITNPAYVSKEANIHPRLEGRMSPAQALMGLLSLDSFTENVDRNRRRYVAYQSAFADIEGIQFIDYAMGTVSNYQQVVCVVDDDLPPNTRDRLIARLRQHRILAKRYYWPGVHRQSIFQLEADARLPVTDSLCQRVFQLPCGSDVTHEDVSKICGIIRDFPGTEISC